MKLPGMLAIFLGALLLGSAVAAAFPLPGPGPSHALSPRVVGWTKRGAPVAPAGFQVNRFASGLDDPRNLYVDSAGDVFVAESEPKGGTVRRWARSLKIVDRRTAGKGATVLGGRILLLRDADNDGTPDVTRVLLAGLNRPFGMLAAGGYFYVADEDALWRYPYKPGDLTAGTGTKILALPAGGDHWTRTLSMSADGSKLYIGVGSATNIGEQGAAAEHGRAQIVECNPDGTGARLYAGGLRNPSALAVDAGGQLWTAVNERDGLGDALVPDYLTRVADGQFFGWPYSYYGGNIDARVTPPRPDLVARAAVPDYMLGAHVAPLGLVFYNGPMFPEDYAGGAFVGEHGSWNSSILQGYKVVFIPFRAGMPAGNPQDFLTDFIAGKNDVHGRPVAVVVAADGSLLVADDAGNAIWRVSVQD